LRQPARRGNSVKAMSSQDPTPFQAFLASGLARGGFATDDVLAAVLPLMRQACEAHAQGLVAPLERLAALTVREGALCFDAAAGHPARHNPAAIESRQKSLTTAVEVRGESKETFDVDSGLAERRDLAIGTTGEDTSRPVYLPGYVSWEHAVGHHDELTDVFSLGLILASLACGLDLDDAGGIETLVRHRANLFALNPRLNPVVASVIAQMTELDRHRRAQDLPSLIGRLEHYREQTADLNPANLPGYREAGTPGRRKLIQTHLRDRLFDLSRRNRLLYFKPTLQTLNLTLASVPLVVDFRSIRQEDLFTWNPRVASTVTAGGPVSLGRYLRFEDAPYVPGVLDKIISEARKDRAEYGCAQLRLVVAFLRWHNLKEGAAERIHSPLLLLPVQLTRKRAVRDIYLLTASSSEAEVNPVLRHHLKQLYGLDLPPTVDLAELSMDEFHLRLQALIQAGEPGVVLEKIDRPQIEFIHQRARQRLDQFNRRTGARTAAPRRVDPATIEYSYDRTDRRPRGLQLFLRYVRPAPAPLRDLVPDQPGTGAPPSHVRSNGEPDAPAAPPAPDQTAPAGPLEASRTGFALRQAEQESGGNAYRWGFDLCAVTLGNFNYRKMTLVRDYTNLLESGLESDCFDRLFSLDARPPEEEAAPSLPLADQHLVLPCDATQASAIARARRGGSYIIQGPPGTGKSQTITNLIADYVARGLRVLFVCEKRAAIDVVFHRLRQQGLDELCCLIHDSQTDKRAFIQNLKATAEAWLASAGPDESAARREEARRGMELEVEALGAWSRAMSVPRDETGLALRGLLDRMIELRAERQQAGLPPAAETAPEAEEDLPHYHLWRAHGATARRLAAGLAELGGETRLARHPFRWVGPAILRADRPLATLRQRAAALAPLLEEVKRGLDQSALPREEWESVARLRTLLGLVARLEPLAARGLLPVLDARGKEAKELGHRIAKLAAAAEACARAAAKTVNWRRKLPPEEVESALAEARRLQNAFLVFLRPGWWRLRRVLNESYDFKAHRVPPGWVRVLTELAAECSAAAELAAVAEEASRDYGTADLAAFSSGLAGLREEIHSASPGKDQLWQTLLPAGGGSPSAPAALVESLERLRPRVDALAEGLAGVMVEFEPHSLEELAEALGQLEETADDLSEVLPQLAELADCASEFSRAVRQFPLTPPELENAIAWKSLNAIYRQDRPLIRFDSRALARRMERLAELHREWLALNAAALRAAAKTRFRENVQISTLPAAALSPEQKLFKKTYSAGRRELEHEFGKTMRYKSIRELAGGDTGRVIRDLKPIWLMSPLSISDTLPIEAGLFDVVIFDEASQVPVEEAVPAIYRARQVIVVGDEKQLPPTNFFTAARDAGEGLEAAEGDRIEVVLDADSLLTQSAAALPSTLLAWHYRSRSESLISFSNAAFYGGGLFTIPDRHLPAGHLREILVADPVQGDDHGATLLDRSLSFHLLETGVYEDRRNRAEAAYIARLVRATLARGPGPTLGVVAFSEAQQSEIEDALQGLAETDPDFGARLEAEYAREEHDQFCGLFVKNLENVQGDERDIIILSICYARDAAGRMAMNFGPINQRGGERRLNVIFSRARLHTAVVSSIRHQAITNDFNDGANTLKNYLRFAEMVSRGDQEGAIRVLESVGLRAGRARTEPAAASPVAEPIARALRDRGHVVDTQVGQSRFRCDLAVRQPDGQGYALGILIDSEQHYRNPDLVERYLMQPAVLGAFGWKLAWVLTKDWLHEPDAVLARLEKLLASPAPPGRAAR